MKARFVGTAAGLVSASFVLATTSAHAGGSISLDEAVERIFKASPALVAEVAVVRKRLPDPSVAITCDAEIRLGNSWRHLSATRIVPIECEFRDRTLTVNGKVTFKDAKGRILTEIGPKTFRNAVTVEQTDLTWTWE